MSNAKRASEKGFSLVETVAAMGILALAAIPLMQVTTDASRNAASLEARLFARTVAENVMARSMTQVQVIDGGVSAGQETQMGRDFVWSLTAGPPAPGTLQNLTVTVRPVESQQILANLTSLKYIPENLPSTTDAPSPQGEGTQ